MTTELRDAAAPSTRPASGAHALVRGASRWLGIVAVLVMLVIMVREIVGSREDAPQSLIFGRLAVPPGPANPALSSR